MQTEYLIQVEQLDTHTNKRSRYYVRRADDDRKPAIVTREVANHLVANMGNDFRYRRHAKAVVYIGNEVVCDAAL